MYLRRHRKVTKVTRSVISGRRAVRAGATLAPDRAVGRRTWEEFLSSETGADMVRKSAAA